MASLWILFSFCTLVSHAVDFTRPSFVSVISGERVAMYCTFQDTRDIDVFVWYKQQFGELPQEVGRMVAYRDIQTSSGFDSLRFKVEKCMNGISLTILQMNRYDDGLYFCGVSTWGNLQFSNGTFVTVTDDDEDDVKMSVVQSGVWDSVPAGGSRATLQCSVLSERTTADLRVLWFRSAPSQSHPQIIYTHHNNNNTDQRRSSTRTCVYNISVNDTGTYYCAVVLCGRIVFGNGIPVQLGTNISSEQHFDGCGFAVICLAVALAVCVLVIVIQSIFRCKKRNPKERRMTPPEKKRRADQECDGGELNYAALNFTERKTKRGRSNRYHQDTIYSETKCTHVT